MKGELVHNPTFKDLDKEENAELRFFLEGLSLVDAVNGSNLLIGFATEVRESKDGSLKWGQIPGLFAEGVKSRNYVGGIQAVGDLVEETVRKGWVTPLRTKSLAAMAFEAYNYHKGLNAWMRKKGASAPVSQAWKQMTFQMVKLAQFQDENMFYHADFQKVNYRPHPDSWKVYFATVAFILAALVYAAFLR